MSSLLFRFLCDGVLAPKVDKLVPPQCAASADRFPVKRLTRAAPADRVPSFSVSKALLVRRVAYCFDLGRCSSTNKRRKSMAYKLLASPKETSQGSASGRLSNSGICVNINFVPAIKAFHKGRPLFRWVFGKIGQIYLLVPCI
jgi:hypothetical protein